MSGRYRHWLDREVGAFLYVEFATDRRKVIDYAVVLTVQHREQRHTVRVYDGTHGINELHRYTLTGGKQAAQRLQRGTLGEGMRAAIAECKAGYEQMIEGWWR